MENSSTQEAGSPLPRSVATPHRIDWNLMGVHIGTATGWDMQDVFSIVIYDFIPNEAGLRFVPDFVSKNDLTVNWERGIVAVYDEAGNETLLKCDWSVFNKEGGMGWQVGDLS